MIKTCYQEEDAYRILLYGCFLPIDAVSKKKQKEMKKNFMMEIKKPAFLKESKHLCKEIKRLEKSKRKYKSFGKNIF